MTILKATILEDANSRLLLSETNIDAKVLKAIQEIVSVVPGITETSGVITISDGSYGGTLPTGFVAANYCTLTNASGVPLEHVKDFADLLALRRSDAAAGTPASWSIYGSNIQVHPKSDGGHVVNLFYENEDTSADSITLPDCAGEAVLELVCWYLEVERGMVGTLTEQASGHERLAKEQIQILRTRYARRKG